MNLNDLAREITLAEGKRISLPIGQVKEVMALLLRRLAIMSNGDLGRVLKRYRPKEANR